MAAGWHRGREQAGAELRNNALLWRLSPDTPDSSNDGHVAVRTSSMALDVTTSDPAARESVLGQGLEC